MTDTIYMIDHATQKPLQIEPVSFADIGVRERYDLQPWVQNHPGMLGEELLILTSEFDRFDRSKLRLDLLALDKAARIVVIELKLDANRSLADLQAIRYAAFCSTMTMDDLVTLLTESEHLTAEEATQRICEFLECDDLPALEGQPRMILAAGVIDDQELTSCVLWLRKCGVDVSCVELTPYRLPKTSEVLIVPKVIIPIPEARDYIVSVERKEAVERQNKQITTELEKVGYAIAEEFEKLNTGFRLSSGRFKSGYMVVRLNHSHIHYEWLFRKRDSIFEVALHCEYPDLDKNEEVLDRLRGHEADIAKDAEWEFDMGQWGKTWTRARFCLPIDSGRMTPEIAPTAARAMQTLIARTWPLIRTHVEGGT